MAPLLLVSALLGAASSVVASSSSAARIASGFTISTRNELSVQHLAEIATIDVEVTSCHSNADLAKKHTLQQALEVRERLQQLVSIDCDAVGRVNVQTQEEEEDGWSRSRYVGSKDQITIGNEAEKGTRFCGETSIPVTINDVDQIPELKAITTEYNTGNATAKVLDWVDWSLSNTTSALQKTELRKQAFASASEIGKSYASALGVEDREIEFIGIEEGYEVEYEDRNHRRWRWNDDDEADLTVPQMKTNVEFVLKFKLL